MTPERWNHIRELTEECRPLLATAEGMDAVQQFLGHRRVWVLDAILVTRELLSMRSPCSDGPMRRWFRSYWDEEDTWFYFEIGGDGWVTRQVELQGAELRPVAAARHTDSDTQYGTTAESPSGTATCRND